MSRTIIFRPIFARRTPGEGSVAWRQVSRRRESVAFNATSHELSIPLLRQSASLNTDHALIPAAILTHSRAFRIVIFESAKTEAAAMLGTIGRARCGPAQPVPVHRQARTARTANPRSAAAGGGDRLSHPESRRAGGGCRRHRRPPLPRDTHISSIDFQ